MILLVLLAALLAIAQSVIVRGPQGPYLTTHEIITLVDKSRWDPYAPAEVPHKRRILISVFTPLDIELDSCDGETIPYLPPFTADTYVVVGESIGLPDWVFQGFELEFCKRSPHSQRKWPVVIFSPGFSASRLLSGAQAQSLASQGYLVITVDHPYDATVVEFPDGGIIYGFNTTDISPERAQKAVRVNIMHDHTSRYRMLILFHRQVRSDDVSFLVDEISSNGRAVFDSKVDPGRIFIYGHSLGGATAAQAAFEDDRIIGGLNFDGAIYGSVAEAGMETPFYVVGTTHTGNSEHFSDFMGKLRGPKMLLTVEGTEHLSYMDAPLLVAHQNDIPPEQVAEIEAALGGIDGRKLATVLDEMIGGMASFVFEKDSQRLCNIPEQFSEVLVRDEDMIC